MRNIYKKTGALITASLMTLQSVGLAAAQDSYEAEITNVEISESGIVASADVEVNTSGSYKLYAAVYEDGVLKELDTADITSTGRVQFEKSVPFDKDRQELKCFIWTDEMEPAAEVYKYNDVGADATADPTTSPTEDSTAGPTEDTTETPTDDSTASPTEDPVSTGYKAVFITDEHASITVSDTQDFTNAAENATEAYARNSDTGEIDTTGDGQVNFKVILEDGYEIDSVTVTPAENYKNLKEIDDITYRVTKITGDVTVEVATKEAAEPTPTPDPADGDGIIHLLGDSINAAGVANVTVDGTTVTITAAGNYTVEGTLDDGQIAVKSSAKTDVVNITLDGVNVTNTAGNAFNGLTGQVLLIPTDNESTFRSSSSGDDTTAIYSKNDLTIKGDGRLNAISEYGNGIRCKNDIEIGVCDLTVNAANNGIKGDESVKITKKNNSVTVVSGGDGIKSDTAPAIDETTGELTGGAVTINGGTINITTSTKTETDGSVSTSDGIQADTMLTIAGGDITIDATGEAIKANASSIEYLEDATADQTPAEGDGCVIITDGTINISAGEDGIKAVKNITVSGGNITISQAEEGIQVNEIVYDTDGTTILDYVEGEIDVSGGTIDIVSSEDGIQCGTGNVVITDGSITVDSQQDCIQGEFVTNISGGTFDLTAYNGAPQNVSSNNPEAADSCKGVKAGNLVYISGGTFDINTYDDAIHSNNTVRILGGSITAATGDDGVHGDSYLYISDNADINITKSYEGIEAAEIYISGGETRVVSTDDGANAAGEKPTDSAYDLDAGLTVSALSVELYAGPGGNQTGPGGNQGGNTGPNWGGEDSSTYGYLEVSGGLLYIEAEGDGFDSNGSGLISGGTVLVNGPTSGGNGVFDIGDNSGDALTVTGGTVIGAGSSDMAVTPTTANDSQYYVVTSSSGFSSQSAGKAFKLTNSSGNEIVTYVPSKSYSWVFVSTPDMTNGSYTLNYGGSVTNVDEWIGNLANTYGIARGGTYSGSKSVSLTAKK